MKKPVTYLYKAGEQAASQFANAEAITYFSRALNLTAQTAPGKRYDLLLGP